MLPYAPTTNTSYTLSTDARVNHHEPVRREALIKTPHHKAVYDTLCEVYAIICTTQTVETAFTRDFITDKEKYTATVLRLVSQYKVLVLGLHKDPDQRRVLHEIVPEMLADPDHFLRSFCRHFGLECPLAIDRLLQGVPATIEQMGMKIEEKLAAPAPNGTTDGSPAAGGPGSGARLVAEATGNFITLMDALKLDYNSKTQLHPLLSNLVVSLNELILKETEAPVEFPAKPKLVSWLIRLNGLSESESLTPLECEEFLDHVDKAYHGFYNSL